MYWNVRSCNFLCHIPSMIGSLYMHKFSLSCVESSQWLILHRFSRLRSWKQFSLLPVVKILVSSPIFTGFVFKIILTVVLSSLNRCDGWDAVSISGFSVLLSEISCFAAVWFFFYNQILYFHSFLITFCHNLSKPGRSSPIISSESCMTVTKEL